MDKKKDEKKKEIGVIDLLKIVFSDKTLSKLSRIAYKEFTKEKNKLEKKRNKK